MPVAHARTTDPDTSHEAAVKIGELNPRRAAVYEALGRFGPVTHDELSDQYAGDRIVFGWPEQTPQSVRSRCAELVKLGLVEWNGDHGTTSTGGKSKRWRVVPTSDPVLFL